MATLRNKWNLAAINSDNHEDHPRKMQAQNAKSPRMPED